MIKTVALEKIFRTEEVETLALNKVSIEVKEGEFVAIMGPSGCGKSTLLNILGLLDNPTSGEYYLNGIEVSRYTEAQRTKLRKGIIGFVFQSFNLIDELNVYENIELPLLYMGVSAAERKKKEQLQWLIDKEGSLYGLIANREDNFTDLDENNKEGIFEIQFDDQNKGGTGNDASMAFGFQRTQFYAPSGIGWGDGKARRWLVDEFLKEKRVDGKNDLRLYGSILYRGFSQDFPDQPKSYYRFENADWNDGWGTDPEDCYIRKYNTSYYRSAEDYFARNNYRIMRYADILMNYAECLVETGTNPADAAVYVDKVRERAGLAKLEDSQWKDCLSSKDAFIKRLQMERTLELCFEGWRWADLKRWGLLDSQAGIDELKARDKDFDNFIVGKHRRLPIPRDEVENSTVGGVAHLTQNPNY